MKSNYLCLYYRIWKYKCRFFKVVRRRWRIYGTQVFWFRCVLTLHCRRVTHLRSEEHVPTVFPYNIPVCMPKCITFHYFFSFFYITWIILRQWLIINGLRHVFSVCNLLHCLRRQIDVKVHAFCPTWLGDDLLYFINIIIAHSYH